jgi:NAD+ synthase (glutamine-hydrolysing)
MRALNSKKVFANMKNDGFLRVSAVVPQTLVGDVDYNKSEIIKSCKAAYTKGARVIVFPELSLTSYSCADLFGSRLLLEKAESAIQDIAQELEGVDAMIVVGAPLRVQDSLYNCAVVLHKGKVEGVVPKSYLPNYGEFYEKRWFSPADTTKSAEIRIGGELIPFGTDILFEYRGAVYGIEICEDLWVPIPPSCRAATAGANVILNLSASNETIGKHDYLCSLISQQSARLLCAYVYSSAGYGESSTDLVFAGNAIIAENGKLLEKSPRFTTQSQIAISDIDIDLLQHERMHNGSFADSRQVDINYRRIVIDDSDDTLPNDLLRRVEPHPFVPGRAEERDERCREIVNIQTEGLMRRLSGIGYPKSVIGISGGLDSTLALLTTAWAYDRLGRSRKEIIGITMPGFGTTSRTHNNATELMSHLGVTSVEISIADAASQHLSDIKHDASLRDVTYENAQARERTQVLMDYANKVNGIVIGTGDLSELALGWCTYNGDQMSMYGVNASIPKTLVKHLVKWFGDEIFSDTQIKADIADIIDTPISPELLPPSENAEITQKTEELVGPYELHDFILYQFLRHGFTPKKIFRLAVIAFNGIYTDAVIAKWLRNFFRRFFSQQFKRSCMPDGPKVGSVCLSPRGDWRMPSDASSRLWLKECDEIIDGLQNKE